MLVIMRRPVDHWKTGGFHSVYEASMTEVILLVAGIG